MFELATTFFYVWNFWLLIIKLVFVNTCVCMFILHVLLCNYHQWWWALPLQWRGYEFWLVDSHYNKSTHRCVIGTQTWTRARTHKTVSSTTQTQSYALVNVYILHAHSIIWCLPHMYVGFLVEEWQRVFNFYTDILNFRFV